MSLQHKNLAAGQWQKFTLMEQMGNIGSEVGRALHWQNKDETLYTNAIKRSFELLDLTIRDPHRRGQLKEIVRARELLGDAIFGGKLYGTSLNDLDRYFFRFGLAARILK